METASPREFQYGIQSASSRARHDPAISLGSASFTCRLGDTRGQRCRWSRGQQRHLQANVDRSEDQNPALGHTCVYTFTNYTEWQDWHAQTNTHTNGKTFIL